MVFDINLKMPAVLVGDAEKISHVLKILLENSLKYTEEGELMSAWNSGKRVMG